MLRPYQQQAVAAIEAGWAEHNSQLCVMPTGTGKTVVFGQICKDESEQDKRVLVLAGRDELLQQAQDKLLTQHGVHTALEKGSSTAHDTYLPVVVASVQSLHAKRLAQRWPRDAFDLIIYDEAHHILAKTSKAIIEHFDHARLLGFTATPDRGDKKSLGEVFENIAYEYGIREAITDGYLSRIKAQMIPLNIDISGVKIKKGDYDVTGLDASIAPYLQQAAEAIQQHAADRKTLVFLPLIKTSQKFVEVCQSIGINAVHVDGTSPDRKEILADYAAGKYDLLSNSALLLEGYDCPPISCVVSLRPTKSRPLYAQMIGRGTRIAPGKPDLLILDFLWQSTKHNLCQAASLFAKSEDKAKAVMAHVAKQMELGGGAVDLFDAEEAAESEAQKQREASLAEQLRKQQGKQGRAIDPLQFAVSIDAADLAEYEPTMRWEEQAPTEKQLAMLERNGIDRKSITCKGHASAIIDRIFTRRKADLCSPKQAMFLRKHGFEPGQISFERASELIDSIMKKWNKSA